MPIFPFADPRLIETIALLGCAGKNRDKRRGELMMRQFLYSSARSSRCGQAELEQILHQSRNNNALDGVTGLLWADERMFVQVLEGTEDAIACLVDRLRVDRRHSDMDVLLDRQINESEFGAWRMAMLRPDETPDVIADRIRALFSSRSSEVARCIDELL